jgi:hypothetical protein
LIAAERCVVSRNESAEKLRKKLAEVKLEYDEFRHNYLNGIDQLRQHCISLRNQVHLHTEIVIEQAHQQNEQWIIEIDKYEQECVDSFNKYRSDEETWLAYGMDWFCGEYLEKFNVDNKHAFESLDAFLQRLRLKEKQLKNSKFNGKIMEFKTNQHDRVPLGTVVYRNVNFDLDSIVELNLNIDPIFKRYVYCFKIDNDNNSVFYIDDELIFNMEILKNNGTVVCAYRNIVLSKYRAYRFEREKQRRTNTSTRIKYLCLNL